MTSSQRNARAADVTLHLSCCCCCSPLRGLPASNRNHSTGGYASRDGDDDALSYPARGESRRRCGPTWPPHRRRDEPDRLCAQRRVRQENAARARGGSRASQTTTQREKKKVLALRRRRQPARCRDSVPSSPFSPGAARASAPLAQLPAGGAKNKRPWAVGSLQEAAPWHTQPVPLRRRIRSCSGQTLSSLSSCPVLSRFFPCLLKNLDALPHRRTSVPSATPPPTVTVRRSHPPIVLPHRLATQLRPPSSHATTRLASRQLLPLPLPAPNHRYTVAMGLPGGIITILHAVLAVFLIIELGLTAYGTRHTKSPTPEEL